ncbi:hypothetical protein K2X30_07370 [bacterium]|nr:hypothetical protein [bacterium]
MKRNSCVKLFSIIALALGLSSTSANAGLSQAAQEALHSRDRLVTDLSNMKFGSTAELALNNMLAVGAEMLAQNGHADLAQKLQADWNSHYRRVVASGNLHAFDVGDHEPLSKWLEHTYDMLRANAGPIIDQFPILADINTMNFAIPVVFSPSGDKKSGQTWDLNEYRKHFIPFTEISVYWVSYGVCIYYTGADIMGGDGTCGNISGLLKTVAGHTLAPRLADYIYNKANQANMRWSRFSVSDADLIYIRKEDLLQALSRLGSR